MKMEPKFEKANEIYFRLGIIYKQQQKYDLSLQVRGQQRKEEEPFQFSHINLLFSLSRNQCFRYILHSPPRPLTEIDIWFQTGHVYEQQKEVEYSGPAEVMWDTKPMLTPSISLLVPIG